VLRSLNRFYLENDAYERSESFASVFFATFEPESRVLTYASAGHEALFIATPGVPACVLVPTGPIIGVFADSPELYEDKHIEVPKGSILLAVSDGVSEARTETELYGLDRLIGICSNGHMGTTQDLCGAVVRDAVDFARGRVADDMAILAVRFL
jgi:serine phosphatase RsbU (regulator of sigma subunit)